MNAGMLSPSLSPEPGQDLSGLRGRQSGRESLAEGKSIELGVFNESP